MPVSLFHDHTSDTLVKSAAIRQKVEESVARHCEYCKHQDLSCEFAAGPQILVLLIRVRELTGLPVSDPAKMPHITASNKGPPSLS